MVTLPVPVLADQALLTLRRAVMVVFPAVEVAGSMPTLQAFQVGVPLAASLSAIGLIKT